MRSSWRYRLFLAIDANFRLKRKKVSSELADPSLSKGWAYFVEQQGYQRHLTKFGGAIVQPVRPLYHAVSYCYSNIFVAKYLLEPCGRELREIEPRPCRDRYCICWMCKTRFYASACRWRSSEGRTVGIVRSTSLSGSNLAQAM